MDFGFYPHDLCISAGPITITTLEGLQRKRESISQGPSVEQDWIYSPSLTKRIFSLPKTHSVKHAEDEDERRLRFLIQCFGLFIGMRMTETEAGFFDATPLKPGAMIDFHMSKKGIENALLKADDFWLSKREVPEIEKFMRACIHNYFLSQIPNLLDFERFNYLYFAFDACHFMASKIDNANPTDTPHGSRIHKLCSKFGIETPEWAIPPNPYVTQQRNSAAHEGLFSGEPLGFALLGDAPNGTSGNSILLQMQCLASRLIIAMLGMWDNDYVRSTVTTRRRFSLDP